MIYQILNNNQKEKKKKLCVGKRSDCVQIVNGQHGLRLVPAVAEPGNFCRGGQAKCNKILKGFFLKKKI